jgi:recombination protein RecA
MTDENALNKVRTAMRKSLKDDFIFLSDDNTSDVDIFIPTGCSALDYAMTNRRNGGVPVGKVMEISGQPGTGKTLLAIHICKETQKLGGLPIFLDTEHAFNEDFAQRIGLNMEPGLFWLENPGTVEGVFKFLFDLCHQIDALKKKNEWPFKFVTVIWDSIASTPCEADVKAEDPNPTATVGLKPRIISKNMATFVSMASKKDVAFVCLNQLRNRINAMPGQDPYIEPGGNAIPYCASLRIRITSTGKLKDKNDVIVGVKTEATVKKTRFGPPFQKIGFPIYFTHGIDDAESIIDSLEKKSGVDVINGGPKGKLIAFKGEGKDSAIKKMDFKMQFVRDAVFRERVLDALDKVAKRDMDDPRFQELEVEAE